MPNIDKVNSSNQPANFENENGLAPQKEPIDQSKEVARRVLRPCLPRQSSVPQPIPKAKELKKASEAQLEKPKEEPVAEPKRPTLIEHMKRLEAESSWLWNELPELSLPGLTFTDETPETLSPGYQTVQRIDLMAGEEFFEEEFSDENVEAIGVPVKREFPLPRLDPISFPPSHELSPEEKLFADLYNQIARQLKFHFDQVDQLMDRKLPEGNSEENPSQIDQHFNQIRALRPHFKYLRSIKQSILNGKSGFAEKPRFKAALEFSKSL